MASSCWGPVGVKKWGVALFSVYRLWNNKEKATGLRQRLKHDWEEKSRHRNQTCIKHPNRLPIGGAWYLWTVFRCLRLYGRSFSSPASSASSPSSSSSSSSASSSSSSPWDSEWQKCEFSSIKTDHNNTTLWGEFETEVLYTVFIKSPMTDWFVRKTLVGTWPSVPSSSSSSCSVLLMTLWCVGMLKVLLRIDFLRFTLEYMSIFSWQNKVLTLSFVLTDLQVVDLIRVNTVLLYCLAHLLGVSSPHAKSLHLTVLSDAADVVHLLKDSLGSATHTEHKLWQTEGTKSKGIVELLFH